MSDENKDKKEPQGCLAIMIVIMTAVLVVLLLVCYKKVELSTLIPELPIGNAEHNTDGAVKETKPKETKPKETRPKETKPKETKPQAADSESNQTEEDVLTLLDKIEALINGKNEHPKPTEPEQPKATEPETTQPTEPAAEESKGLVVIDAGHQAQGNSAEEPIGPGAEETKDKVTSGTQGVVSGVPEYELNLQVAKKLEKLLLARGYQVKMVRTGHNVDLSNAQRAEFANELKADVFIRIHANGDENAETSGIMTVCQTEGNPYNGALYSKCKRLAQCVLDGTVEATGGKKKFVWETDTLSGINWSQVPVTVVEMGYMTNPEEDKLLNTEDYQQKLAEGIANGIDRYFEES